MAAKYPTLFNAKRGELITSTAVNDAQLIVYPIICKNVNFCNAFDLTKKSEDCNSDLISAIFCDMKRAVSRL